MIQAGDAEIVVAGGMESMTQAPYLLPGPAPATATATARSSTRAPTTACSAPSTRSPWAAPPRSTPPRPTSPASHRTSSRPKSHERAAAAIKDGKFADEIVPVEIPQRKGDPILFDTDEGVRPGTTVESLGGLRPAFDKAGNITAGNASQISDGGSAVIVTSKAKAEALGVDAARRDRRLRPGRRTRSRRC